MAARPTAAALPDGSRRIGRITHGTVRFALNLRLHERALDGYLRHVDPGTSRGRRLTAAAFGTRFGLSDTHLSALRLALGRLGIGVERVYPQRTAMLVRGSVPRLQQLFALRFDRYRLPDGRRYYAPEHPPRLPAALTPYVTGLGDLSDRPVVANDIPASGLTPDITARAYGIKPLWDAGIRGKGQTIAIATAFGAINPGRHPDVRREERDRQSARRDPAGRRRQPIRPLGGIRPRGRSRPPDRARAGPRGTDHRLPELRATRITASRTSTTRSSRTEPHGS